ncbi:DUF2147 domain-containing protein [Caldimonas brevitalea]|uniref:DUF2147 domain-containing protein n=1 Tax=Caldimonas brevitalea TaxID=413882 RepID=A0A0G3BZB7_9BURK|nr:DUF2147 domain-containing protein [Caldimonas brevitalea]AKJ31850.1 hypothetical protein AAW51_5159 [Caldimonas brevitalea]
MHLRIPSRSIAACAAALCAGSVAVAQTPTHQLDPGGRFLTASGNLEVEVAPCGGNALCGTVTKVIANHAMSRSGQVMQPADPRPALGMQLLTDFVAEPAADRQDDAAGARPREWRGRIYNRENAKHYDCVMTVNAAGDLVLRGYVGLPLFGRTQTWQRVATTPRVQEPR